MRGYSTNQAVGRVIGIIDPAVCGIYMPLSYINAAGLGEAKRDGRVLINGQTTTRCSIAQAQEKSASRLKVTNGLFSET